ASYEGMIVGLWQAKAYTNMKNVVNPKDDGVLLFDEIKSYQDVNVTNDFTRYKYFIHDLNLVNKVTKSVKGLGFIAITTQENCPRPEEIDFKNGGVNIYVALEDADIEWRDGDIRVTVDKSNEMNILGIDRFENGEFAVYQSFNHLYEEKNAEDKKYSVQELYDYSLEDQASKKRKFLATLLEELGTKGFLRVTSTISLYDNLLVGRKKTVSTKTISPVAPNNPQVLTGDIGENDFEENEQYEEIASLLNFNPNIILYGPPGTGKTFATQRIIDCYEKKYYNSNGSYYSAETDGRVKSVTFHQSYSYEEFIEGIRPVLNDDDGSKVGYRLENGLFKELCINAEKELIKNKDNAKYVDLIHSESTIWNIFLGERKSDSIFEECMKTSDIAINWLPDKDLGASTYEDILEALGDNSAFGNKPIQNANSINAFVNEMSTGDIVLVYDGQQTIRMIGVIKEGYRYDQKDSFRHRRSVEWFRDLDYPINIHHYNGYKNLTMKTIYQLSRMSISDVLEMITTRRFKKQSSEDKKEIKPYYMIVDEINRGNIAKIFGELITLIEQDKRGKFKVVLPYSKKVFSVPPNLVVIGTMNTADRSIAAIDTALRRRFTFVELEPDASIITKYDNPIVNDSIDLIKLLNALNEKIMIHFDRDHRIGHAYFMGIDSLSNFYQIWYYKVLPLLSEYFYNDVETISAIVGKSFIDNHGNFIKLQKDISENGLSAFEENIIKIYKVSHVI
ncbi:AAA family ATPase, partial [Acetobacterium sp.]|uniref:AAA family ATPase n=1 Tax=Acetobacterium sp. TaxID=1872094 RepID=UPI00271D3AA8